MLRVVVPTCSVPIFGYFRLPSAPGGSDAAVPGTQSALTQKTTAGTNTIFIRYEARSASSLPRVLIECRN